MPVIDSKGNGVFLPYSCQSVDKEDVAAVLEVLSSDWLTTGPKVEQFERVVSGYCSVRHAVAVSSGTAALHAAMYAIGISPGDEVIVPTMTFVATANCVVYQGGRPVFADVEPDTLLIAPASVAKLITPQTKAIIAVDYAGQPCDYDALQEIADRHGLVLVADACHSIGGRYKGRNVGTLADLTVFSFHPVKQITTGEGGMVVTDRDDLAAKIRRFRNHGIDTDHRQREQRGTWQYDMSALGYNYRISDIQCALGISQLLKLPGWLVRRREIAAIYDKALVAVHGVSPLSVRGAREHGYHLYVVRIGDHQRLKISQGEMFHSLREAGIGVNVHYKPVHLHAFYQKNFFTKRGDCPVAESAYEQILSLPLFPSMSNADVNRVVDSIRGCLSRVLDFNQV